MKSVAEVDELLARIVLRRGPRSCAAVTRESRQLLPHLADLGPGVVLEAFFQIEHGEIAAGGGARKPLPGDRRGYRRAGPRARRIGRNRRRFARITEIVDENAALAQRLRHFGEIKPRTVRGHR